MVRIARLYLVILIVMPLLLSASPVQAEETNGYLEILAVDLEAYPSVSITVASTNGAPINNASFQVLVDDVEQPIIRDRSNQVIAQSVLLLDPRNLDKVGIAEQPHYAAIMAALLDSMEKGALVEELDWLFAATAEPNGGLNRIQDWTLIPAEAVEGLLSTRGDLQPAAPISLADSLMYALDEFRRVDNPSITSRSLIVFTVDDGENEIEEASIRKLVDQANSARIQVFAMQFTNQGQNSRPNESLMTLASQSGGRLLMVDSLKGISSLFREAFAGREQRTLEYISTGPEPSDMLLQLTLDDGTTIQQTVNLASSESEETLASTENSDEENLLIGEQATEGSTIDANVPESQQSDASTTEPLVTAPPLDGESSQVAQSGAGSSDSAKPSDKNKVVNESDSSGSGEAATTSPESSIRISQNLLIAALPILLALLALFCYQEIRYRLQGNQGFELRADADAAASFSYQQAELDPTEPDFESDPFFELNMPIRSTARHGGFALNVAPRHEAPEASSIAAPTIADSKTEIVVEDRPMVTRLTPHVPPGSAFNNRGLNGVDILQEIGDQPGMSIHHNMDDEATFRLHQPVELPILGYLVRVTRDESLPQELPIYQLMQQSNESRQIYIGRHSRHNTLVLNSKFVSREHAILIQKGGELYLRDNKSTTGTALNGKNLAAGEELLLRHKDVISFGQVVYEFCLLRNHEPALALTQVDRS